MAITSYFLSKSALGRLAVAAGNGEWNDFFNVLYMESAESKRLNEAESLALDAVLDWLASERRIHWKRRLPDEAIWEAATVELARTGAAIVACLTEQSAQRLRAALEELQVDDEIERVRNAYPFPNGSPGDAVAVAFAYLTDLAAVLKSCGAEIVVIVEG